MIPGKRRSNLVLFQRPGAPGDVGYDQDARYDDEKPASGAEWVNLNQAWVSVDPDRGREVFRADEREAIVMFSIRGDYLDLKDIDETMRMVLSREGAYDPIPDDSQVYLIRAVLPNMDVNDDIMLKCELEGRNYAALT